MNNDVSYFSDLSPFYTIFGVVTVFLCKANNQFAYLQNTKRNREAAIRDQQTIGLNPLNFLTRNCWAKSNLGTVISVPNFLRSTIDVQAA